MRDHGNQSTVSAGIPGIGGKRQTSLERVSQAGLWEMEADGIGLSAVDTQAEQYNHVSALETQAV